MLHSTFFEEFLQRNYVVFSWNISNSIDRHKYMHKFFRLSISSHLCNSLIKLWQEYFSEQPVIDFSMIGPFPTLIGLMISFRVDSDSPSEHVPEILLIDDGLVRTSEILELELLFYQLIQFKEEFNKNFRYLVSVDFSIISS